MTWIWRNEGWPNYRYDSTEFSDRVSEFHLKSERLYGRIEAMPGNYQTDALVDLMLSEAIQTSAIEGESLDRESVRSSILNLIGADIVSAMPRDDKAIGAAQLMVDVRQHWDQPLTHKILGKWQSMVVSDQPMSLLMRGRYRNDPSPMQIVSGPIGNYRVHYEAPPAEQVHAEMDSFLAWYNTSSPLSGRESLPGPIRAGVAHVWFENIHPFDDGNGRVGRAIADHALSQSLGYPTMACLATAIESKRKEYYALLEEIGRGKMDLHPWLDFFTESVNQAQVIAQEEVDFVLGKTRFYDKFATHFNERQAKAIARVFTEGRKGFEGGLSTRKYQAITKCSRATAFRDFNELLEMGAVRQIGAGRGTRYELNSVDPTLPSGWHRNQVIQHGDKAMGLAPRTFSDKEIESLEDKISEIFEFTDPTDDMTVLQALESADISQIEAALERLTDMNILFTDLLADIAPSEWRVVSMDHEAFKGRHDQAAWSARSQLKDNLFKAVGKELESDVWEANPCVNYVGDVVRIDQNYLYLQLSENSVSAHALDQMPSDQVEKLLGHIAVGDYVHFSEVGDVEKVERPQEQVRDKGISH